MKIHEEQEKQYHDRCAFTGDMVLKLLAKGYSTDSISISNVLRMQIVVNKTLTILQASLIWAAIGFFEDGHP